MDNNLNFRIQNLATLGLRLSDIDEDLISNAVAHNGWFTTSTIRQSIASICKYFLQKEILAEWAAAYEIENIQPKIIGLVAAGNIPMVGFHDVMAIYLAGHRLQVKLSDKDQILMEYVINQLNDLHGSPVIHIVERLKDYDAVIATGSNNASLYFKKYFGMAPHIIRQNRNGVAVLSGQETEEEVRLLGLDIFTYFGLGCRNVSKVFLPRDYDLVRLLDVLHHYNDVANHNKYRNNFDYNIALFMLNKQSYLNNGSIVILESEQTASRIATLHYEYYDHVDEVIKKIALKSNEIQCVVTSMPLGMATFSFGQAQEPSIQDYADGVDTLQFLTTL